MGNGWLAGGLICWLAGGMGNGWLTDEGHRGGMHGRGFLNKNAGQNYCLGVIYSKGWGVARGFLGGGDTKILLELTKGGGA